MSESQDEVTQDFSKLEINSRSKDSGAKSPEAKPIESIEFVLCDTEASFSSAVSLLEPSSSLIIDCEGLDLGINGGALSLVCIRSMAPQISQNFLFDFVALSAPRCSLQPLFNLLASPTILKILYDGRMDFSALYHGYNVELVNVIDLELVDIKSRFTRGETPEKHKQRLMRCFSYKQVNNVRYAYKYEDVHVFQGLGSCLIEHGCKATSPKKHVDHELWMSRPLPNEYLQYAAHDVEIIDALHSHFVQAGYIDQDLPAQSQRFVSIWSDAPPQPGNNYRSNPLLPLEILKPNASTTTIPCTGCARNLSPSSFPHVRLARYCWVCLAVPQWLHTIQFRKEQREKQKALKEAMKNDEEMKKGIATSAIFGDVPTNSSFNERQITARGRGNYRGLPPTISHDSTRGGTAFRVRGTSGMMGTDIPLNTSHHGLDNSTRGNTAFRGRGASGTMRTTNPPIPDSSNTGLDNLSSNDASLPVGGWRRGQARGAFRGRGLSPPVNNDAPSRGGYFAPSIPTTQTTSQGPRGGVHYTRGRGNRGDAQTLRRGRGSRVRASRG
ncbi:MAG: ribonuclease H-like domain-containing protein [Lentinula lateritia]|uniref:Ribonuclease H-like domain-containing protein n=1 Tax=Lentinula lateritia TaxID=40482 RepID=A0ABQ8VWC1_9AGAR|nr:MAG: ribonuclease H-like domain-containing protein [Lentinula lateritia]KAJ4500619.1 ribonuclease H-like domain-containing protein [Lentinula lateritia]